MRRTYCRPKGGGASRNGVLRKTVCFFVVRNSFAKRHGAFWWLYLSCFCRNFIFGHFPAVSGKREIVPLFLRLLPMGPETQSLNPELSLVDFFQSSTYWFFLCVTILQAKKFAIISVHCITYLRSNAARLQDANIGRKLFTEMLQNSIVINVPPFCQRRDITYPQLKFFLFRSTGTTPIHFFF